MSEELDALEKRLHDVIHQRVAVEAAIFRSAIKQEFEAAGRRMMYALSKRGRKMESMLVDGADLLSRAVPAATDRVCRNAADELRRAAHKIGEYHCDLNKLTEQMNRVVEQSIQEGVRRAIEQWTAPK